MPTTNPKAHKTLDLTESHTLVERGHVLDLRSGPVEGLYVQIYAPNGKYNRSYLQKTRPTGVIIAK